MYSHTDLPAGADYWRDSSPLGMKHSSPNLRHAASHEQLGARSRVQSMAGLSMWGPGSVMGDAPSHPAPFLTPMMTGMSGGSQGYANPFAPPASDYGLHPPPAFTNNGMLSNVPRNSMMSMGGMAQNRMSSYSLATTANPFMSAPALTPDESPNPPDEKVLGTLRRYLAQQDLMTV